MDDGDKTVEKSSADIMSTRTGLYLDLMTENNGTDIASTHIGTQPDSMDQYNSTTMGNEDL